jgi:hypothetical protein
MVKNDALFSYIAPTNIFAWLLMPIRYCMPLPQFVWLNRTIIKVTHFPVLFLIYVYERFWLAPSMFEPTDLIENRRGRDRTVSFADPSQRTAMFSPNVRVREESVAGFQKDRALEEVFRRAPDSATLRTQRRNERRKTQTEIRNWMEQHDEDGASPSNWPTLDSRAIPDWQRRMSFGWDRPSNLRQVSEARSVASDPAELYSGIGMTSMPRMPTKPKLQLAPDYKDHTDADGDDELVTNDEDDDDNVTNEGRSRRGGLTDTGEGDDYFMTPMTSREGRLPSSHGSSPKMIPATPRPGQTKRGGMHSRSLSTTTILYNPEEPKLSHSSSSASAAKAAASKRHSGRSSGGRTPGGRTSPQRPANTGAAKSIPIRPPPGGLTETGGVSRTALLSIEPRNRVRDMRRLSSVDISIMSDNTNLPFPGDDQQSAMAGSFQTQMAMAMMKDNRMRAAGGIDAADRDRMGRLVLARMKTLEESFAEVIKEMRGLKGTSTAPQTRKNSSEDDDRSHSGEDAVRPKRTRGDATPKKTVGKRPVSRRSMKEPKVGLHHQSLTSPGHKGKGKEIAYYSSDDEGDGGDSGLHKRGSSY